MKEKKTVPTMKDVAREAGVAIGTVSRVINGCSVRDDYRQRVEEAIAKLDYHVNTYAQGLKAVRTYTAAVLIPNTCNPFFGNLVYHLHQSLTDRNYHMLLCCTDYHANQEQEYIRMARQNKVDGIIGLTYSPDLVVDDSIPFISIDRSIGSNIPCVASDNFYGGQLAAEKLSDLGCRHVAFLRIGSSLKNEPNKRKAGFENGCLSRDLSYEEKILNDGDSLEEFRAFLTDRFHNGRLDFDGLFCVTDEIAAYVIQILTSLGIRVPQDVQVIGFDGIRIFGSSKYLCSTIVQPVHEIAETCVNLLLQEQVTSKPPLICLPVSYVPGGTTRE